MPWMKSNFRQSNKDICKNSTIQRVGFNAFEKKSTFEKGDLAFASNFFCKFEQTLFKNMSFFHPLKTKCQKRNDLKYEKAIYCLNI